MSVSVHVTLCNIRNKHYYYYCVCNSGLRTCWQKFPIFIEMASTSLQPLLIFDLFLLNSTTFVVRTRGFVCVVYLLSCLASHKDPCKWCMVALFIPQYIRTCLSRQNLFGSYMWVMGYFHKADYIFFLFTQLVNESCALHTAMVFMAWKLLWHTCKCSWSFGALMWIK